MHTRFTQRCRVLLAAVTLFTATADGADPSVPQNTQPPRGVIRLGMSTALTGPSAKLGTGVLSGVRAAIDQQNKAGGVNGRIIELIALDDGYEPARAIPNTHELIEKHKVVAMIGNVGTPTAVATLPILAEAKVPLVAAFTGAGALRKSPPDRYVINFRSSYAEETGAMVDNLIAIAGLKPQEIALFTQRDAYGDAGLAGVTAALKRHGLSDTSRLVHARYERNTTAVENAVADVLTAEPQPRAVIMVGAYAPCAEFVKRCRAEEFNPLFLNVSFVGAEALAEKAGPQGDGVFITQVLPHHESDAPLAVDFRKAMAARPESERTFSFTALEGYAGSRMVLLAMASIKAAPNSESIVDALEGLGTFDIGTGEQLKLSPTEHQASHRVWLTVLRAGKVLPAQWSDLRIKDKNQAGVQP
jgi:branched-chain amino acid transport system substrate-binding protein